MWGPPVAEGVPPRAAASQGVCGPPSAAEGGAPREAGSQGRCGAAEAEEARPEVEGVEAGGAQGVEAGALAPAEEDGGPCCHIWMGTARDLMGEGAWHSTAQVLKF